jgi:MFS family permease
MRMTATYAAAAYFPVYYSRAFPEDTTYFSITHAFCILGGGGVSAYVGGRVADRYGPRQPSILASLPGYGGVIAVLPLAAACFTQHFQFAMFMLAAQYLFAECWLGPGMTLLQVCVYIYCCRFVIYICVYI